MIAEKVFRNGQVLTVNKNDDIEEAVAVKQNIIIAVGKTEWVNRFVGDATEIFDLKGRTLIPGFIDSHMHTAVAGMNKLAIDCRVPNVNSIEDILDRVREAAKNTPIGDWIRGWGYNHTELKEKRHPNRWELDKVAPKHPVMLTRICSHISVHNSISLQKAWIDAGSSMPGLACATDGELNGLMIENAHMAMMKAAIPSEYELIEAMSAINDSLISEGITSVHDSGGYGAIQMKVLQKASRQGVIKPRIYLMIFSFADNRKFIEDYLSVGVCTGFGNDKLSLGPIKLMLDGSSSGPTAATLNPYKCDENNYGILSHSQEEVDHVIIRAHRNGWQTTGHAVGDAGVTMMVNAIEKAQDLYPREDARHRIEHCAMLNTDLLERIKRAGIIPIPNPIFLYQFGDGYMRDYGEYRAAHMFDSGGFIKNGIMLAGASDSPIAPSNPLLNMHVAINRKTNSGKALHTGNHVNAKQALRMFTYNGAYSSFDESIKGSIEVGKLADLVILEHCPYDISPEKMKDIEVELTMIDGEVVYRKKGTPGGVKSQTA
ncbi:MAG: amidohydrolase [Clostridiales Family XIII bacterium]|jgi:predicted amidohydrolase YtcJ|nr:amidohydrolase [Clostridiales Family XIII bacterium]